MNTSPFKTFEEFSNATGSIAAFSLTPAMNYILCLIGLALTVWFIVAAFRTKH